LSDRSTLMPFPNQDYNKRDYLLPAGCKDLADAIKCEGASVPLPAPEPPITRHVTLPEKVSVRFLAEISGQALDTIARVMSQLRIGVSVERSVDFEDAARILRRYGIAAEKTG
jgi:hypothetical protein